MGLWKVLENDLLGIIGEPWSARGGRHVPDLADLSFGNDGMRLKATVLYADLSDSTKMVDTEEPEFAAEIYKAFLICAGRIIRSEDGIITAYDGDRVMAVFIGENKNTRAVTAALTIKGAVQSLIQPAIEEEYPDGDYVLRHVCGVDTSEIFVAKTGFRGSDDLVWVGRAANYAAKLTALDHDFPTWITADVFKIMNKTVKESDGRTMWDKRIWTSQANREIYRSNWMITLD
jgi:class 3 adenylate cyclase